MIDQYEALQEKLLLQLREIEGWESVQNALNISLSNDSDETDYDKWLEGSMRFARENETVLKALVR